MSIPTPRRLLPDIVVRRNVGNQSSRNGAMPRLIVLHSTESNNIPDSANDLRAIGAWFDNPASDASAHTACDGDGTSARYVNDSRKAWACAAYNSVSYNLEIIGRAGDPKSKWTDECIKEAARWIAHWSLMYDIPIQRVHATGYGVVTHKDLGVAGGGHHDPGSFPVPECLELARRIKAKRLRLRRRS